MHIICCACPKVRGKPPSWPACTFSYHALPMWIGQHNVFDPTLHMYANAPFAFSKLEHQIKPLHAHLTPTGYGYMTEPQSILACMYMLLILKILTVICRVSSKEGDTGEARPPPPPPRVPTAPPCLILYIYCTDTYYGYIDYGGGTCDNQGPK